MTHLSKYLMPILILSLLGACKKTPTAIASTWRNPAYTDAGFSKLFVIGVGENDETRRLFENAFAQAITSQGATAQASWSVLPQSEQLTEPQVRAAIEGGDFDGVLVTRLLSVDEYQVYVPPSTQHMPTAPVGATMQQGGTRTPMGYFPAYSGAYAKVHEDGYYETNTTYHLQTDLYSVATGDLVWWGRSGTVNPSGVADGIDSMTQAVAEELGSDKLLP